MEGTEFRPICALFSVIYFFLSDNVSYMFQSDINRMSPGFRSSPSSINLNQQPSQFPFRFYFLLVLLILLILLILLLSLVLVIFGHVSGHVFEPDTKKTHLHTLNNIVPAPGARKKLKKIGRH